MEEVAFLIGDGILELSISKNFLLFTGNLFNFSLTGEGIFEFGFLCCGEWDILHGLLILDVFGLVVVFFDGELAFSLIFTKLLRCIPFLLLSFVVFQNPSFFCAKNDLALFMHSLEQLHQLTLAQGFYRMVNKLSALQEKRVKLNLLFNKQCCIGNGAQRL